MNHMHIFKYFCKNAAGGALLAGLLLGFPASAFAEAEASILLFADTCQGVLTDDGTFVCSQTLDPFNMTGTWTEGGYPKGDVVFEFESGKRIEASYSKKGLIQGKVTEYQADGTYVSYYCDQGYPYGKITMYASDGSVTGYDRFYQTRKLSDLIQVSTEHVYQELFTGPANMLTPAKITGRVEALLDTRDQQSIVLKSDDGYYYVLSYYNLDSGTYKINQAICPNFRKGDRIVAYGFFQGCAPLSDLAGYYESSLVDDWEKTEGGSQDKDAVISSLEEVVLAEPEDTGEQVPEEAAAEVEEGDDTTPETVQNAENAENTGETASTEKAFRMEESLTVTVPYFTLCCAEYAGEQGTFTRGVSIDDADYKDILSNPYLYGGSSLTVQGEVTQAVLDYQKTELIIRIAAEDGGTYIGRYSFETSNPLPTIGDQITVDAKCAGNYKALHAEQSEETGAVTSTYVIYPYLKISKIQF